MATDHDPFFVMDRTVTQGDDDEIVLSFSDADGLDVDISLWDFWYTVKANANDADSAAVIQVDPTDVTKSGSPTQNTVSIPIASADTTAAPARKYGHDIKISIGGKFQTIMHGILTIKEHQTKRTT